MWGVDGKQVYNDLDNYSSLINDNPTRGFFWIVEAGPLASGASSWSGVAKVEITYYTMFYNRDQIAPS